ncbi:hypothetical protein JHW43_001651 [Diplocarpon mali]|nr:hypothetical protein JHW43_001651 [Diplocarpon mali]
MQIPLDVRLILRRDVCEPERRLRSAGIAVRARGRDSHTASSCSPGGGIRLAPCGQTNQLDTRDARWVGGPVPALTASGRPLSATSPPSAGLAGPQMEMQPDLVRSARVLSSPVSRRPAPGSHVTGHGTGRRLEAAAPGRPGAGSPPSRDETRPTPLGPAGTHTLPADAVSSPAPRATRGSRPARESARSGEMSAVASRPRAAATHRTWGIGIRRDGGHVPPPPIASWSASPTAPRSCRPSRSPDRRPLAVAPRARLGAGKGRTSHGRVPSEAISSGSGRGVSQRGYRARWSAQAASRFRLSRAARARVPVIRWGSSSSTYEQAPSR